MHEPERQECGNVIRVTYNIVRNKGRIFIISLGGVDNSWGV